MVLSIQSGDLAAELAAAREVCVCSPSALICLCETPLQQSVRMHDNYDTHLKKYIPRTPSEAIFFGEMSGITCPGSYV